MFLVLRCRDFSDDRDDFIFQKQNSRSCYLICLMTLMSIYGQQFLPTVFDKQKYCLRPPSQLFMLLSVNYILDSSGIDQLLNANGRDPGPVVEN